MPERQRAATLAVLTLLALATAVSARATSTLTRDLDPVVLLGSELDALRGTDVDRVVGFRWDGGWIQIPVQIDERAVVDFGTVYDEPANGITMLAYVDPNTYAGADPNAAFDSDDELVFMAADAGGKAPPAVSLPNGVLLGGTGLEVDDPTDGGEGWIYLFESDGSLDPNAQQTYGTYTFNLTAGSYIPNYSTLTGPNPEDSDFTSALYTTHFSDRWIRDELGITAGSATGVDVLDRHKNMFAPGNCSRTEDTFSNGEGAFFANRDGAVRAIRSYMGANSGPFTQRDHLFYRGRQDVVTFLRVHAIGGIVDLYDYSPSATGMTYYNQLNTEGAAVDGVADTVAASDPNWEMVTGPQGTVTVVHDLDTDTGLVPTSYYSDDATPLVTQCTGDAFEYATSGPWVTSTIPNTDPALGSPATFISTRTVYYDPPSATVAHAQNRSLQARTSLLITVHAYSPTAVPTLGGAAALLVAVLLLWSASRRLRGGGHEPGFRGTTGRAKGRDGDVD